MSDHKLLGRNYTTPDLIAKVTGRAKYAEDCRTDGVSFCRLLLSPMPHCRVRRIDASGALAMPEVPVPDPETPVGARGVGEPPVGAGLGAVLNGVADAVGDDVYRRIPVMPDVFLASLDAGRRVHDVRAVYVYAT